MSRTVIAVDIGFGWIKWFANEGKELSGLFPSVIGESITNRSAGVRGLEDVVGDKSFVIELNQNKRLIGESAAVQSRMRFGAMNETRFADAETVQLFTIAAIESYFRRAARPESNGGFLIVGGIPLASYLNYRDAMQKALTGVVEYSFNGEKLRHVNLQSIILPSPLGPYLDFLLDEDGTAPRTRIYERVGVIVIGTLTTEFTKIIGGENPQPVDEQSGSIHTGLSFVTSRVTRWLKDTHNLNATHYEIDQLMTKNVYKFGRVEFEVVARAALAEAGKSIANQAQTFWGTTNELDAIIVSGGAAKFIAPLVQKELHHPNFIETPNPILSTARGYWKYGRQAPVEL